MNPWSILPLASFLTFAVLLALVVQELKSREDKVFSIFLFASAVWSFTSFMLVVNPNASSRYLIFWNVLVVAAIPWVVVAYYHFVRVYTGKNAGLGTYLGYTFTSILLTAGLTGHVVKTAYIVDGYLYHDILPWEYIGGAFLVPFLFSVIWMLLRKYRISIDPADRNRTAYLIFGWSAVVIISFIVPFTPALAGLPIDHIGNLANALIITYVIKRYKLLDIRLVVGKGLLYSSLTIFLTTLYLLTLLVLQIFFLDRFGYSSILLAAVVAVITAVLFNPLRNLIQQWIDKLFYRETYDYRQMLLNFSNKVSNVLDLRELARSILEPIVQSMHVKKAALLLPEFGGGDFRVQYIHPQETEAVFRQTRLLADNPIVTWMAQRGIVVQKRFIDLQPQFKGLWEVERVAMDALGIELFCPIRSKGKLVGILALGEKQSESPYSTDETSLLMTMSNEAAMALENARMLESIRGQQLQVEQLLSQVVMAQEEERKRISADLHDSVAQWLAAASYRVQTVSALLPNDSTDEAKGELDTMEDTIDKSLKELRRIVVGLRPVALDELGLIHAIRQILEELKKEGITYRFTESGQPYRLPGNIEIAVYRAVQEALTNIRKHAEATRVTVHMHYEADSLAVKIRDNGKGFDLTTTLSSAISVGHMGVLGMKQRVETLGGQMEIKSSEGAGTQVTLVFPIQTPAKEK